MRCSALVALLSGVMLYLAVGALVFRTLEARQEKRAFELLHDAMDDFRRNHSCVSEQKFNTFVRRVMSAVGEGLDATSNPDNFTSRWDLVSAFFFCGTIITTIGFGNLSPCTPYGQLFCVCYALVGIPMFGILLAGVGDHLGTVLRRAVAKIETIFLKREVSPTMVRVISAVLSILIGCIIFLAVPTLVFHEVEDWTFLESLYCVVMTLTTIGFGDFVPVGDREADVLFKPLVLLWIVFGLSYFASILTMIGNWLKVLSKRTRTEMEELAEELAAHATDWTQNIQNMSMDFRIPNPLEFNDPFLLQRRRWKRSERRRLRRGAHGTLGYRARSGSQNGHLPNRWASVSRSMSRLEVHPLAHHQHPLGAGGAESALMDGPRPRGGGTTVPRVAGSASGADPRMFARSLSLPVARSTCELDSPDAAAHGSGSLYDSTSSSFSSASSSLAQHMFKPCGEAVGSAEPVVQDGGAERPMEVRVAPDARDLHTETRAEEEMTSALEEGDAPSTPPLLPSSSPPTPPSPPPPAAPSPSPTPPLPSPSCQLLDFFGENFAYIDESSDTLSEPVQPATHEEEARRRRQQPRKPKRKSMRRQIPHRWSPVQDRRRLDSNNEPPSNPPTPPPDSPL